MHLAQRLAYKGKSCVTGGSATFLEHLWEAERSSLIVTREKPRGNQWYCDHWWQNGSRRQSPDSSIWHLSPNRGPNRGTDKPRQIGKRQDF